MTQIVRGYPDIQKITTLEVKEQIRSEDRAAAPGPGVLSQTNSKKLRTSRNDTIKESSASIVSRTGGKVNNKQQSKQN